MNSLPAQIRAVRSRSPLWQFVRASTFVILALLPVAPRAQAAATKPCQDGAAITVDGTINKFVREAQTRFHITDTGLDCEGLYFLATNEQSCVLGSHVHVSGTLTKPATEGPRVEWSIANATFSCQ